MMQDLNNATTTSPNDNNQGGLSIEPTVTQEDIATTNHNDRANEEARNLPPGVTEEPQDPEHMHLQLVRGVATAEETYLRVSDDSGQILSDETLEADVMRCCARYFNLAFDNSEFSGNAAQERAGVENLILRYLNKINVADAYTVGVLTKYRIRLGIMYLILKQLVKAAGGNWGNWITSNVGAARNRSLQNQMKLAKIRNIIRYAVFGTERLLKIERVLSATDLNNEDPIGNFLSEHDITFNPEQENIREDLILQIDIAIAFKRVIKVGITSLTQEQIASYMHDAVKFTPARIRDYKIIEESADLIAYLNRLVSDGSDDSDDSPEGKALGFRKTTDEFLKSVEAAVEDNDYLSSITAEQMQQIKVKIEAILARINDSASAN